MSSVDDYLIGDTCQPLFVLVVQLCQVLQGNLVCLLNSVALGQSLQAELWRYSQVDELVHLLQLQQVPKTLKFSPIQQILGFVEIALPVEQLGEDFGVGLNAALANHKAAAFAECTVGIPEVLQSAEQGVSLEGKCPSFRICVVEVQ